MSQINQAYSESKYAGEYHVTASTLSGYGITDTKKAIGTGTQENLGWSASTAVQNGVLNTARSLYTSITTNDFTVDTTQNPIHVYVNSVLLRWAVPYYHNNVYPTDTLHVPMYTDNGATHPGIDRTAQVYNNETYQHHLTAIEYPSTWQVPANKHFSHWNTDKDGNGTSYFPGDSVTGIVADTPLYAIYEDDGQYTITVHFDSNEINSNLVDIIPEE